MSHARTVIAIVVLAGFRGCTCKARLAPAGSEGRRARGSVPLEWFPRLRNAGDPQRAQWRLIGGAVGVAEAAVDGREAFRYGIAG